MYIQNKPVARTDAPNTPNIRAVVDATVRTWIPALIVGVTCFVTPARAKLDVRSYDWAPQSGWITRQSVETKHLADIWFTGDLTAARPRLDVRSYDWSPEFIWPGPIIDQTVRTWASIWSEQRHGERLGARPSLDVRAYEWSPQPAWIFKNLPTGGATTAQTVPAWNFDGDRTPDRARLDIRRYDWSSSAWITANLPPAGPSTAQTVGAWADDGGRTIDARKLDVRLYYDTSPLFGVPDDPRFWPCLWDTGGRTVDRAKLDVRASDWAPESGWIFTSLPAAPATQAQIWPAILQGAGVSYRTAARALLDVRSYEWAPDDGWLPRQAVEIKHLADIWPTGDRTADRLRLDVRSYEWSPESGWLFTAVQGSISQDQLWPAILEGVGLSYRTPDASRFDVRRYEWAPEWGWLEPAVERVVSTWMPAVVQAGRGFRTDNRPLLDVRTVDPPVFGWVRPVVDRLVASWMPAIDQELASGGRTADDLKVEVRLPWIPSDGWIYAIASTVFKPPPTLGPDRLFVVDAVGRVISVLAVGRSGFVTPSEEPLV